MKLLLFVIGTEWIVVLVVVAILLLFGGTKLPQLAKALGQSKKAFKEGIDEERHSGAFVLSLKATLVVGKKGRVQ